MNEHNIKHNLAVFIRHPIAAGFANGIAQQLAMIDNIDLLEDIRRRLLAMRSYVTKRESRVELQAAERWCEVRIGELLGPAQPTWPGKKNASPTGEVFPVARTDKHKFRLLAQHRDLTAKMIQRGILSRNRILAAIVAKLRNQKAAHEGFFEGVKIGVCWPIPGWLICRKCWTGCACHCVIIGRSHYCIVRAAPAYKPKASLRHGNPFAGLRKGTKESLTLSGTRLPAPNRERRPIRMPKRNRKRFI